MTTRYIYRSYKDIQIVFEYYGLTTKNFSVFIEEIDGGKILMYRQMEKYPLDDRYVVLGLDDANDIIMFLAKPQWYWGTDKNHMIKDLREAAAKWAKKQIDGESNMHVETLSKALEAHKADNQRLKNDYDELQQEYDDLEAKYRQLDPEVWMGVYEANIYTFGFEIKQEIQIVAVKINGVWKKVRFELPDGDNKVVEGLIPGAIFLQLDDMVKLGSLVKAL